MSVSDRLTTNKELWDRKTFTFDRNHPVTFPRLLTIADKIKETSIGPMVLDLGCGLAVLRELLGKGFQYFGCDISLSVVHFHNTTNIVQCDLDHDSLPFRETQFNYVVCSGIIEFLSDVRKFLRDILQTYGHEKCLFLITVTNATNLDHRMMMLMGYFPRYDPLYRSHYSPKDFFALLRELGFNVLSYYPTSYVPHAHMPMRISSPILHRILPSIFGDQFLFVCRGQRTGAHTSRIT